MHVCLDIRVSTKGGTSTFVENFVRQLDEVDHSHTIQYVAHNDSSLLNGKHERAAVVPHRNRWLEFQWSQLGLSQVLRQKHFDVYHSLKHLGPIYCPTRTIYRVPAVGQFFGNYPMPSPDHLYWAFLGKQAYRRADLLVAVSNYIRQGLIEGLGISEDRVVTIYNGLDSQFRKLAPRQIPRHDLARIGIDRPYLLCVGNLVPVKNFGTAIRAYKILRDTDRIEPLLVLAGSTKYAHSRQLNQLVEQLGLAGRVLFIGYRSGNELLHLYNAAQMLVHPSLHEGFSFTILEAMACGLPIVASATTSIPEAAGAAACYYENPTNAEQLADCIRRVLESPELSQGLSRAALQRAAEFSWSRCVGETVALYQDRF